MRDLWSSMAVIRARTAGNRAVLPEVRSFAPTASPFPVPPEEEAQKFRSSLIAHRWRAYLSPVVLRSRSSNVGGSHSLGRSLRL
jgi:hypothetical protein